MLRGFTAPGLLPGRAFPALFHAAAGSYNEPVPQTPDNLARQLVWLLVLAMPVAAIARTLVYEELFREPREWCIHKSRTCRWLAARKFFYAFTCDYCLSHWVSLLVVGLTRFKLLIDDWRGYIISWLALVFIANVYLNLYARLRVDITSEKKEIEAKQKQIEKIETELKEAGPSPR